MFVFPIEDHHDPKGTGLAVILQGISLSGYVLLVDWSSRLIRLGQVSLSAHVLDILTQMQIDVGSSNAILEELIGTTNRSTPISAARHA